MPSYKSPDRVPKRDRKGYLIFLRGELARIDSEAIAFEERHDTLVKKDADEGTRSTVVRADLRKKMRARRNARMGVLNAITRFVNYETNPARTLREDEDE